MMAQHKSVDFDVSEEALGKLPKATNAATSLGDALRKINVAGFFKGALEGSEQLIQRAGEYRAAMAEDDVERLTQLLDDGRRAKEEVDGR